MESPSLKFLEQTKCGLYDVGVTISSKVKSKSCQQNECHYIKRVTDWPSPTDPRICTFWRRPFWRCKKAGESTNWGPSGGRTGPKRIAWYQTKPLMCIKCQCFLGWKTSWERQEGSGLGQHEGRLLHHGGGLPLLPLAGPFAAFVEILLAFEEDEEAAAHGIGQGSGGGRHQLGWNQSELSQPLESTFLSCLSEWQEEEEEEETSSSSPFFQFKLFFILFIFINKVAEETK